MDTVTNPVPQHPRWCGLEPLCTADRGGLGASHRSEAVTFTAAAVSIEVTLFKATPGWDTEVFATLVVSDSLKGTANAAFTVSVEDAWRLTDTLTGLLERVR